MELATSDLEEEVRPVEPERPEERRKAPRVEEQRRQKGGKIRGWQVLPRES